jgi:hypothetical protein
LIKYRLHEEVVKLAILAPLLTVSGLGSAPFVPKAEKQIEITFPNPETDASNEMIRGRIDLLVLCRNLWVVTIETKPQQSDVLEALPQALTYMMANSEPAHPLFGLLTNGRHFMFVKLARQEQPTYGLSELFTLFRQGNELYQVTAVLQRLGQLVMQLGWENQKVGFRFYGSFCLGLLGLQKFFGSISYGESIDLWILSSFEFILKKY